MRGLKMKVATSEDMGRDAAIELATLHTELKAKGIESEIAEELCKAVAGAMKCCDGNCGGMARPGLDPEY